MACTLPRGLTISGGWAAARTKKFKKKKPFFSKRTIFFKNDRYRVFLLTQRVLDGDRVRRLARRAQAGFVLREHPEHVSAALDQVRHVHLCRDADRGVHPLPRVAIDFALVDPVPLNPGTAVVERFLPAQVHKVPADFGDVRHSRRRRFVCARKTDELILGNKRHYGARSAANVSGGNEPRKRRKNFSRFQYRYFIPSSFFVWVFFFFFSVSINKWKPPKLCASTKISISATHWRKKK